MTSSRSKTDFLGETTKSKIQEMVLEEKFGIRKEIFGAALDKGKEMEKQAILLCCSAFDNWRNDDVLIDVDKPKVRLMNDWIVGEPDVLEGNLLADVKCSFDKTTFPWFASELENKDYYWQMQGYMWLTNQSQCELVYCLVDTPEWIITDLVRKQSWSLMSNPKYKDTDMSEVELQVEENVRKMHIMTDLEIKNRVKRFIVHRNDEDIQELIKRLKICRNYYENLMKLI
jgi:hypothetical protein